MCFLFTDISKKDTLSEWAKPGQVFKDDLTLRGERIYNPFVSHDFSLPIIGCCDFLRLGLLPERVCRAICYGGDSLHTPVYHLFSFSPLSLGAGQIEQMDHERSIGPNLLLVALLH